jgi:hypothetical protein
MSDDLNERERRALAAWAPITPPLGFADRVVDARESTAAPRARRMLVIGGIAAACAAAAIALVVLLPHGRAASGTVAAGNRSSTRLGDRGVAVAEPGSELTWRVDGSGATEIDQRTGNVFYRVERGEPFVVHTPAGDVRVTGTCFRIEVTAMKPVQKMLLSGVAGAALASTVFITVYEGSVLAETKLAKTELPAGSRATFADGKPMIVAAAETIAPLDIATASREQLIARASSQQAQIAQLEQRLAQLENGPTTDDPNDASNIEPGRAWHDPSPEKLKEWAKKCHVRFDHPNIDRFTPLTSVEKTEIDPGELDAYNAAVLEIQKKWKELVRALYIEATGDVAGAETLSTEAMRSEIEEKSPKEEHSLLLQKLSRERAGLQPPPADLSKTSPFERLMRALVKVGDDTEKALARRLGPTRAADIRRDGFGSRSDMSGCPE